MNIEILLLFWNYIKIIQDPIYDQYFRWILKNSTLNSKKYFIKQNMERKFQMDAKSKLDVILWLFQWLWSIALKLVLCYYFCKFMTKISYLWKSDVETFLTQNSTHRRSSYVRSKIEEVQWKVCLKIKIFNLRWKLMPYNINNLNFDIYQNLTWKHFFSAPKALF